MWVRITMEEGFKKEASSLCMRTTGRVLGHFLLPTRQDICGANIKLEPETKPHQLQSYYVLDRTGGCKGRNIEAGLGLFPKRVCGPSGTEA